MYRFRVFLSLGLLLCFGVNSYAAVFIVTDTNDSTSVRSLRGAIIFANRIGGRNTIELRGPAKKNSSAVFHLTISGPNEDAAQTGDLDITKGNLTILGSGASTVIDATGLGDRVFQVAKNAQLTLSKLTITGGRAPGADFLIHGLADGGAIYNAGSLNLLNCTITNNASGPGTDNMGNGAGNGGAIENTGVAQLSLCSIIDNRTGNGATGDGVLTGAGGPGGIGGGIFNVGTMSLINCVVSDNSCGTGAIGTQPLLVVISWPPSPQPLGDSGAGGSGGGIYNLGQLQIDDSAIYYNQAGNGGDGSDTGKAGSGGNGGGIFNLGTLVLNTSTLSSNLCGAGGNGGTNGVNGANGGSGGGIYNIGSLNLTSATIVLNQTGQAGNGGQAGSGGGISNGQTISPGDIPGNGNISVVSSTARNTIIALNTISGASGIGPDVAGYLISGGFNLVGITNSSIGFTGGTNINIVGSMIAPINPVIGPLQMNGGPTPTHALLPGSPAIDRGNCFKIRMDQRGVRRPFDDSATLNAPGGDGSDIGAFEVSSAKPRN